MQIIENTSIGHFSWLNERIYKTGGGKIKNLYLPDTKEELIGLIRQLYKEGNQFYIFGHTSNCYFLPSFSAETVISTRRLYNYKIQERCVICEPGAHIKDIAKKLTNLGIKGYSGMIDLPGTVAAAVYGNAGCFGCETKDIVSSVELLCPNGEVHILSKEDLVFQRRSSALKRKDIEGVILSVTLKKEKGNRSLLINHAEACHKERQQTQPGPANNLGSCFMSGSKTLGLRIVERIIHHIGTLLRLDRKQRLKLLLVLLGQRRLIPYLYEMNRFMWIDEQSHNVFQAYVSFYSKIYKNAKLEIQLFE